MLGGCGNSYCSYSSCKHNIKAKDKRKTDNGNEYFTPTKLIW